MGKCISKKPKHDFLGESCARPQKNPLINHDEEESKYDKKT